MTNPFTLKSAVNYTNNFIDQVCTEAYSDNQRIEGSILPKLTPFREFNFILLYILLQSWKNDAKKLRSPYFDFSNEAVKQALQVFMNTLSKHISIPEEDFKPLAKKSYQLTLLYFNDVLGFLSEVFTDKVSAKELTELNKFLKSNALKAILDYMKEENETELQISELELEDDYLPSKEKFLTALQDYLDVIEENEAHSPSGSDSNSEPETNQKGKVNEAYTSQKPTTVHDTLNQSKTQKTVLESFSDTKKGSIKDNIKLNEQLLITKAIFEGEKEDYIFFIDSLDNTDTLDKAMHILNSNVDQKKNLVQYEFLKSLISAKFNQQSNLK